MTYFKAEMHQTYTAPPDPLAWFKGPISKEGKGKGE